MKIISKALFLLIGSGSTIAAIVLNTINPEENKNLQELSIEEHIRIHKNLSLIKFNDTYSWTKQFDFYNLPSNTEDRIFYHQIKSKVDMRKWCTINSKQKYTGTNRKYNLISKWCTNPLPTITETLIKHKKKGIITDDKDWKARVELYKATNVLDPITKLENGREVIVTPQEITEKILKNWCLQNLKERYDESNKDLFFRIERWCLQKDYINLKNPLVSRDRIIERLKYSTYRRD